MLSEETVKEIFTSCPKLMSLTILGGHQIRLVKINKSRYTVSERNRLRDLFTMLSTSEQQKIVYN